jgi:hypothetical protein
MNWPIAARQSALVCFKNPAAASDIIEFLFSNSAPEELAAFHVSAEAQLRLAGCNAA